MTVISEWALCEFFIWFFGYMYVILVAVNGGGGLC